MGCRPPPSREPASRYTSDLTPLREEGERDVDKRMRVVAVGKEMVAQSRLLSVRQAARK